MKFTPHNSSDTQSEYDKTLESEWENYWEEYRVNNPNSVGGFMEVYPNVKKKFLKMVKNERKHALHADILQMIQIQLSENNLKFLSGENESNFYFVIRNSLDTLEVISVMKNEPKVHFSIQSKLFFSIHHANSSTIFYESCDVFFQDEKSYETFSKLLTDFIVQSKLIQEKKV